jgi:hypothetical protein
MFSSEVVIMKKYKKVKNTSMFSTSLALSRPLIRSHSLKKKFAIICYIPAMYEVNIKPTHTMYAML